MEKVIEGAGGTPEESALYVTDATIYKEDVSDYYKEKTLELYNKCSADPYLESVERNEDTGAVRATDRRRKKTNPSDKAISVTYELGEDTKGFTKKSCGTVIKGVKTETGREMVTYTGKQLEERCQDVLFHKGCVCVLKPDEGKNKSGNTKASVDCFFMKDGMDAPVKADIKSPTLNGEEKVAGGKVLPKHIGNVIGHGLEQAEDDDADYMILYFDKADYYDGDAVRDGITLYAENDKIENKQIKNFVIVVNDERPVTVISTDLIHKAS